MKTTREAREPREQPEDEEERAGRREQAGIARFERGLSRREMEQEDAD